MKKAKQILAVFGIVFIFAVNVLLIFAAGTASEDNSNVFHAAVVAVVLVPVLLWIYLYIYKLIRKKEEEKQK